MKIIVNVLFLAASVFALAEHSASPAQVVADFHSAMQSGRQADVEALMNPEALIYESGYIERTRSDYAEHHLPGDIAYAKKIKTKLLKQAAIEAENLAVITSETETIDQSAKEPINYAGTETMVLRRVNGEWRIAHIHWSSRKLKK
ncbi:YybH family protein [Chitinimonas naiadis]